MECNKQSLRNSNTLLTHETTWALHVDVQRSGGWHNRDTVYAWALRCVVGFVFLVRHKGSRRFPRKRWSSSRDSIRVAVRLDGKAKPHINLYTHTSVSDKLKKTPLPVFRFLNQSTRCPVLLHRLQRHANTHAASPRSEDQRSPRSYYRTPRFLPSQSLEFRALCWRLLVVADSAVRRASPCGAGSQARTLPTLRRQVLLPFPPGGARRAAGVLDLLVAVLGSVDGGAQVQPAPGGPHGTAGGAVLRHHHCHHRRVRLAGKMMRLRKCEDAIDTRSVPCRCCAC